MMVVMWGAVMGMNWAGLKVCRLAVRRVAQKAGHLVEHSVTVMAVSLVGLLASQMAEMSVVRTAEP